MSVSQFKVINRTTVLFQGEGELIVNKKSGQELWCENSRLREENLSLKAKVLELERNNTKLNDEINKFEKQIKDIPQDIEDMRKLLNEYNECAVSKIVNEENMEDFLEQDYAMDLFYSIKLMIYMRRFKNLKNDSFTNIANNWIKKNTPYLGIQDDSASRRLREIVKPICYWSQARQELFKGNIPIFNKVKSRKP